MSEGDEELAKQRAQKLKLKARQEFLQKRDEEFSKEWGEWVKEQEEKHLEELEVTKQLVVTNPISPLNPLLWLPLWNRNTIAV